MSGKVKCSDLNSQYDGFRLPQFEVSNFKSFTSVLDTQLKLTSILESLITAFCSSLIILIPKKKGFATFFTLPSNYLTPLPHIITFWKSFQPFSRLFQTPHLFGTLE